jgi:hypothetical protein
MGQPFIPSADFWVSIQSPPLDLAAPWKPKKAQGGSLVTRTPIHYEHNPLIVLEQDLAADWTFPLDKPADRYIDGELCVGSPGQL